MTNQIQIDNFCERLAAETGSPQAKADCWAKAFDALVAAVDSRAKTIVFLDEISWMGKYDPAFAGVLKTACDGGVEEEDCNGSGGWRGKCL